MAALTTKFLLNGCWRIATLQGALEEEALMEELKPSNDNNPTRVVGAQPSCDAAIISFAKTFKTQLRFGVLFQILHNQSVFQHRADEILHLRKRENPIKKCRDGPNRRQPQNPQYAVVKSALFYLNLCPSSSKQFAFYFSIRYQVHIIVFPWLVQ